MLVLLSSALAQPGWLEPVQRGFRLQQTDRWAEAAQAYREAIASGLPAEHQLGVASNLGLSLQKRRSPGRLRVVSVELGQEHR